MSQKKSKEVISKELLDVICCPVCKGDLKLVEVSKDFVLECLGSCKDVYPIKDGIPVLLPKNLR